MKLKNNFMLKKEIISSSTLNANNTHQKAKMNNNNIFIFNNKDHYNKLNKDNKSILNKIRSNVLFSSAYNAKNDYIYKKNNLKKFFFNKNSENFNENQQTTQFNDLYYYKNYDFTNKNKLNHNIAKSQRIFKFYKPQKDLEKEKIKDIKPLFYRYSSTNINNNDNIDINNNIHLIMKANCLNKRNKMINSAKYYSFKNNKNSSFPKNIQKLIKFHKTNCIISNSNSKEKNRKLVSKNNFIIKNSIPKTIKNKEDINKKGKKRPLSTRYKLNIPKNVNSLDDLLDINEKNCANSLSIQITKYTIGKTIGRGAYALVKIVIDKETNDKYAAKIYNKSDIKDKIRKKCVSNEIEILKRVSHKNIIKLKEVIELKDHILLIQELFIGISLYQYYHKHWKSEDLSKEKEKTYKIILKQIFEAINYLHINNIAHLDIKLENILINKNLEIKLIDFGFGVYDPKKGLNHFFGGTPNYRSPEIVLKRPYVSILSDIWSLGILIFKLFCNDYPFKGLTEKDLYISIKKGKFRIKYYVNYDVKKMINSMLVLDPDKRLSCEELLKNPWFSNKNIKNK